MSGSFYVANGLMLKHFEKVNLNFKSMLPQLG